VVAYHLSDFFNQLIPLKRW